MVADTAYVRGTIWGFLLVGLSHQHLWFRSRQNKEIVVGSGEERAGDRCLQCGAVTVYPLTSQWSSQP
jgi:hypothetical protein